MSRRWYRYGAQVIFVGWEPAEQGFYVNVVDLCDQCGGSGEQDGSDEICPGCNGEGMMLAKLSPSERRSRLSLDDVSEHLSAHGLPFPPFVRTDLAEDQRTNAANLLREYDIETR